MTSQFDEKDSKVYRERLFQRSHLLSPAQPRLLTAPDLKVKGPTQVGSQVLQRPRVRTGTIGNSKCGLWTLEPSFSGILMRKNIFRQRRGAGSRGGNKRLHVGTQGKAVCGRFVNSRRDRGM